MHPHNALMDVSDTLLGWVGATLEIIINILYTKIYPLVMNVAVSEFIWYTYFFSHCQIWLPECLSGIIMGCCFFLNPHLGLETILPTVATLVNVDIIAGNI